MLAVYWWEARTPDALQVELLSALAGQAAIALENARLYQAATNRGRGWPRLDAAHRDAHRHPEPRGGARPRGAARRWTSSARASPGVWLVDDGRPRAVAPRQRGRGLRRWSGRTRVAAGEGLMGHIVATPRARSSCPTSARIARPGNTERIRAEGIISFAGVPLMLGDRVLGALSVSVRERRPFDDEDLNLLQSLGSQAAVAIAQREPLRGDAAAGSTRPACSSRWRRSSTRRWSRSGCSSRPPSASPRSAGWTAAPSSAGKGDRMVPAHVPVRGRPPGARHVGGLHTPGARTVRHSRCPRTLARIATRRPVVIDDAETSDLMPRAVVAHLRASRATWRCRSSAATS